MPNILQEFYRKNVAEPRKALNDSTPDHLDPMVSDKQIHEIAYKKMELLDYENGFFRNLGAVAAREPEEKLRRIYRELKPRPPAPGPAPAETASKEELRAYNTAKRRHESYQENEALFIRNVRAGKYGELANFNELGEDDELHTMPRDKILGVVGDVLGPEACRDVLRLPIVRESPLSYPPEQTTHRPMQAELDALTAAHTNTGDPARDAENRRLLERAGKILEDIRPEVQSALNHNYISSPPDGHSVESIVEGRVGTFIHHGMELLDPTGRFKGLVQTGEKSSTGAPLTTTEDVFTRELSGEELAYVKGLKDRKDFGLSRDTKDAMLHIKAQMDALNYVNYGSTLLSRSKYPLSQPVEVGERFIFTEQSSKHYAFIPVTAAKQAVASAVRKKDLKALADAVREFDRIEKITDDMMDTLRSEKLSDEPFFSSNVDSTRSSAYQIPAKYILDLPNHSKLNSLNTLYATLHNAKVSLDELLNDPMGACEKLGEHFLQSGLDGRPENVGAALQNGLKGPPTANNYEGLYSAWTAQSVYMFRGITGLAGLEKDPVRRDQFLAAAHLGFLRAAERIRQEDRLLRTEQQIVKSSTGAARAMRGVIYQTAALAPETGEDRFNLRRLMEDFSKPRPTRPEAGEPQPDEPRGIESGRYPEPPAEGQFFLSPDQQAHPDRDHKYAWWDGHAAVQSMIRDPGSADFRELARRNARVVEQAERERQLSGSFDSGFSPDLYLLHAYSAQSRLLRNASEADRQKPGFREFKESVENTWRLAKDPNVRIALYAAANREALDLLKEGRGLQPKFRDSEEYSDMKASLEELQAAESVLQAGNPEKIEKLTKYQFAERLADAKRDAFRYVRLKMKNGVKSFDDFVYRSGVKRAEEGLALWRRLGQMEDDLGLRSPARKALDEAREALLLNRADSAWRKTEGPRTLAKLIYADSLIQSGMSPTEQERNLSPEQLEKNTRRILAELPAGKDLWEKKGPVTHAIRQDEAFRKFADKWAVPMKDAYEKQSASARLARAREDCSLGFAMDQAANELDLRDRSRSADSVLLHRMAGEILQRPDFRETMERLMAGRSAEELRKLHAPAAPARGPGVEEARLLYSYARETLVYEKRCAALAAEASLRRSGQQPDRKEIDKLAGALRKNPGFQAFIRSKVEDRTPRQISEQIEELESPEVRRRVLEEIGAKVTRQELQPQKQAGPQADQPFRIRINQQDPFVSIDRSKAPKQEAAQDQERPEGRKQEPIPDPDRAEGPKQDRPQGSGPSRDEFKRQLEQKLGGNQRGKA